MGTATGNPTWQNSPSTLTPISAQALNKIETVLDKLNNDSFGRVVVVTGNEARKNVAYCLWWDTRSNVSVPGSAPINMQNGDEWKIVGGGAFVPPDPEPDPSDVTAPTVPTGLTVTGTTSNSLSISWDASTDAVGVSAYEVRLDAGTAVAKATTPRTHTFSGLQPSSTYSAQVRARDAAGNWSAWSSSVAGQTAVASGDVTSPSVPTGLTVTATSSSSFSVSWNPSTDNVAVSGYDVRLGASTPVAKSAGTTTHTFTGLQPNTTYNAQVRAKDAAGNASAYSTAVSVVTATEAPTGPLNIFGSTIPTSVGLHTDGGGTLSVGNWFYTTRASGITVLGARFWAPADSRLAGLDVTVQAWTKDWNSELNNITDGLTGATLRQTKVTAGGRAQNAWAAVMFDTPFFLPKATVGIQAEDAVAIMIQYAGGNDYAIPVWVTPATGAGVPPYNGGSGDVYYAESGFNRGITNIANFGSNQTHYGVDLIFELA